MTIFVILILFVVYGTFLMASVTAYREGESKAVILSWLLALIGFIAIPVYTGVPQLWPVLIAVLTMYLLIKGDIAFI